MVALQIPQDEQNLLFIREEVQHLQAVNLRIGSVFLLRLGRGVCTGFKSAAADIVDIQILKSPVKPGTLLSGFQSLEEVIAFEGTEIGFLDQIVGQGNILCLLPAPGDQLLVKLFVEAFNHGGSFLQQGSCFFFGFVFSLHYIRRMEKRKC